MANQNNRDTLIILGLGIGALYLFREPLKDFLGGAGDVAQGAGQIAQGAGSAVGGVGEGISVIAKDTANTWDKGTDVLETIFGQAQRLFQGIGDEAASLYNTLKDNAKDLIKKDTPRSSGSSGSKSSPVVKSVFDQNKALIPKITEVVIPTKKTASSANIISKSTLLDEKIASMISPKEAISLINKR